MSGWCVQNKIAAAANVQKLVRVKYHHEDSTSSQVVFTRKARYEIRIFSKICINYMMPLIKKHFKWILLLEFSHFTGTAAAGGCCCCYYYCVRRRRGKRRKEILVRVHYCSCFCVVPYLGESKIIPSKKVKQQNAIQCVIVSLCPKPTHSVPPSLSYSRMKNLKQSWEKVLLLLVYLDSSAYWENIKVYKSFIAQVVPYNSNQTSPLFYIGFVSCSTWSYFVTSPTIFMNVEP